jgi:hypothetical protein
MNTNKINKSAAQNILNRLNKMGNNTGKLLTNIVHPFKSNRKTIEKHVKTVYNASIREKKTKTYYDMKNKVVLGANKANKICNTPKFVTNFNENQAKKITDADTEKEKCNENQAKIITDAETEKEKCNENQAKIITDAETEKEKCNENQAKIITDAETEKNLTCRKKQNIFNCTLCPYVGRDNYNLQRHLKKHFEPESNQDKRSSAKTLINENEATMRNIKSNKFSCMLCSYKARDNFNLQRHAQKHCEISVVIKCHFCEYWCNKKYIRCHENLHLNR